MRKHQGIALALAAAGGLWGCATTASPHNDAPLAAATAPTPKPAPATRPAPATAPLAANIPVDPAKRLADARSEFQSQHFHRAVELLAGMSDPTARSITAMADLDLARDASDAAPLTTAARDIAAELARQAPARGELLKLYVENPALRSTAMRDQLSKADVSPADLFTALGTLRFNAGDYALALDAFRRGEIAKPGDIKLTEAAFRSALAAKDWKAAHDLAGKAEHGNLDQVHGLNYLGLLAQARGDRALAIADYTAYTKAHPDVARGWFVLAETLAGAKDLDAARAALAKGLSIEAESLVAQRSILLVEMASPTPNQQRVRVALDQAMKLSPNDASLEKLADTLQPLSDVISRRTAKLAAAPEDETNRMELARALARDKQLAQATEIYKPILDGHPDDFSRVDPFVIILLNAGKLDDAIALAGKFTDQGSGKNRAAALIDRGVARKRRGDKDALKDFEAAAALQGDAGIASRMLADSYFDAGMFDVAASRYDKILTALNADPQPDEKVRLEVRRRLAESWMTARDFKRADPLIDQLLKENPKDFQSTLLKGMSQARQGHEEEARAAMNAAVQLDPENPTGLYFRAMVMDTKDMSLAIRDMEHVAATHPEMPAPRMFLVRLYLLTYQDAKAEEAYQKVLKDFAADATLTAKVQTDYAQMKSSRPPQK